MSQLSLFDPTPKQLDNPYAFDPEKIGAAIQPFVRFCKEGLGVPEGDLSLSIIIEEAWKNGRRHSYLQAWDMHNREVSR